jgi:hypothetical protein
VRDLVFVDEMEIRGRQAKVKLWSLPVGVKETEMRQAGTRGARD